MDTYAIADRVLSAGHWAAAGRRLVAKMLAEFLYEKLVEATSPQGPDQDTYEVHLPGQVVYAFRARRRLFDRYLVDPTSVRRRSPGCEEPADDPAQLLLDLREIAGVEPATAAHLVKELATTQLADAHIAASRVRGAGELIGLDYAELEGEMDGHPWLAPNKGRIGFGYTDYLRHAPERRSPVRLRWLAARPGAASWQAVAGMDRTSLLAHELDPPVMEEFRKALQRRGADPDRCFWFPVHPWQWEHVVMPLFAGQLARGDLLLLGEAPDAYLPQQSIRTLTNVTSPRRHHVKLPLSILNTLVYRGLPTERTAAAPKVTELVHGICAADRFLHADCRLVLLGEVASVAVPHPTFETLPGAPYQFRELLGCIWREPIARFLDPGERAMTMAALLHVDRDGRPVVAELVHRSGLASTQWLAAMFHAVLPPLLHYLYRYGLVFSPHGENAILLHRNGVPTRLAIKDFVDDVNLSDQPLPELDAMPEDLRSVLLREPPEWVCQFLWAGLFVGHFRYLSDLVEEHLGVDERRFWSLVRGEILAYQARFPELAHRFRLFDLLQPEFARICLNRNRMLLDGYADRPERPHAATHGTVPNALHEAATAGVPAASRASDDRMGPSR